MIRSMPSPGGRTALLAGVLLLAATEGVRAQGVQFGAVILHGDALTQPRLIKQADAPPGCFWFFTYNFYSSMESRPSEPSTLSVTLSFLTERELGELSPDLDSTHLVRAAIDAGFHTRIHLATTTGIPHVQFQKRGDLFRSRMQLHPAGEFYLARHGIPTRRTANGAPVIRQFSAEEVDSIRSILRANAGYVKPECARLTNPDSRTASVFEGHASRSSASETSR